jgi:hypothetical protein
MDQVPKEEGMSLNNKTRKLTYTVEVECCQECPMFSEGVTGSSDDYCKLLKAFIWKKGDDVHRLFPVECPLTEET